MASGILGGAELIVILTFILIFAVPIAGMWKTFEKAGKPGWSAIIPIYNFYIMTRIGNIGWWWVILSLIPYIGLIGVLKLHIGVSKAFDLGVLFGVGLAVLPWIGWPLLGFGDYEWPEKAVGPVAE